MKGNLNIERRIGKWKLNIQKSAQPHKCLSDCKYVCLYSIRKINKKIYNKQKAYLIEITKELKSGYEAFFLFGKRCTDRQQQRLNSFFPKM